MAKTKSPKTNGVKEAAANPQPDMASAQSSAAAAAVDGTTKAEDKKPRPKGPAPKLEAVKSEPRSNVVPINLEDEIRKVAYLLSERRGFEPGHENEDWLAAEHEVLKRYRQHSVQTA
ncbi:MAG TPA: DUF2934 domain-containing protein [Terriglobales bacterium]|nr:DUF2934 domain-containing protein [Terriglobales bacterium]